MSAELKQKIINIMKGAFYLSLGTVTKEGTPQVHDLAFASEDATVYFFTGKDTRKSKNILNNSAVSYSICQMGNSASSLKGLQAEGTAIMMTDADDMKKVGQMIGEKYPMLKDMPPNPNTVMFKIIPKTFYILDYSISFGHRDKVEF